jgi:hypothetical protein
MTSRKPTAKRQASGAAGPRVSRPQLPAEYGLPKHTKDLLPWSYVGERMSEAMHY